jgi:hypothetical protein
LTAEQSRAMVWASSTGKDVKQVGPHVGNLRLHQIVGAFAEAHRGHDGSDADDDAEHRQARAHLVTFERTQRDTKRGQEVHGHLF